jgi:hypothetical protein
MGFAAAQPILRRWYRQREGRGAAAFDRVRGRDDYSDEI